MPLPTPDPTAYAKLIFVSLGTLAVLQYGGIFRERSGEIDILFHVGAGLALPVVIYAISFTGTNIEPVPG